MQEVLKRLFWIIETVDIFIDPSKDHPLGCPRDAWREGAMSHIRKVTNGDETDIVLAACYCSQYEELLLSKNINVVDRSNINKSNYELQNLIDWDEV